MGEVRGLLKVTEEMTKAHRTELMCLYGGYSARNLNAEKPGSHLQVEVRLNEQYVVVLEVKDLPAGLREIRFLVDSGPAREAYSFLSQQEGAQVIKAWEGVLAQV